MELCFVLKTKVKDIHTYYVKVFKANKWVVRLVILNSISNSLSIGEK